MGTLGAQLSPDPQAKSTLTVIAHSDICNYLLKNSFPLHKLLVLGFRRLQVCTKFLDDDVNGMRFAARCKGMTRIWRTSIFPRVKNFASCPGWDIAKGYEQGLMATMGVRERIE